MRGCIAHYHVAPGQLLKVFQWNYADGNQPDAKLPTLRAALDRASATVRIEMLGDDFHHNAYNSAALASAHDPAGRDRRAFPERRSRRSLPPGQYLIGVDEHGDPDGAVNEDARYFIDRNAMLYSDLEDVLKDPARVTRAAQQRRHHRDAGRHGLARRACRFTTSCSQAHALTVRTTLAQFYDPDRFRRADGAVDYDPHGGAGRGGARALCGQPRCCRPTR